MIRIVETKNIFDSGLEISFVHHFLELIVVQLPVTVRIELGEGLARNKVSVNIIISIIIINIIISISHHLINLILAQLFGDLGHFRLGDEPVLVLVIELESQLGVVGLLGVVLVLLHGGRL